MDLSDLIKQWNVEGEPLQPFPSAALTHPRLSDETRTFLSAAGLPEQAAPFLSFLRSPATLQTPNQYFRISVKGLDDYLVIGHNGSGDPVCIDLASGDAIVCLNHDNTFERSFINSSARQLTHCLLLYKAFYASLVNHADCNDFSTRKFSDGELTDLRSAFAAVDADALDPGTFWEMELDALVWERDN
jgi:hypothetical protein